KASENAKICYEKKVLLYQELFEYFNYERKYVKKSRFFKESSEKIKYQGQILKKTQKSHIINCKTNSQVRFLPSCRERTKIRILAWRWRRQAG
ncbi:hypothetical protein, partial [uncultured Streptococcus sp.]|uniref:hypothetical protein n=1 Tax=uncultured Streptococcus sp. TaxID=83427 RepID=UPI0026DBAA97